MQKFLFAIILLVFSTQGCLDNLKEDIVSCEDVTGACRYEILQSTKYSRLHIEINYVTDNGPDSDAINLLRTRIEEVTDKSSISVSQNSFGSTDESYTLEEILDIEKAQRQRYKSGNTFIIHILYLNGEYQDNDQALGLAYKGSSFVLFKEKIDDASFLLISDEDIEKSVIVHEFGHLLGLVNNGYQCDHPDHEDPDHPNHSSNEESVMYWAIESQEISSQIDGEPPNDFDSKDLDDLEKMKDGRL